jgi:hypothetical protein
MAWHGWHGRRSCSWRSNPADGQPGEFARLEDHKFPTSTPRWVSPTRIACSPELLRASCCTMTRRCGAGATFASNHLWVTPYEQGECYAAGDYPAGSEKLKESLR